MQKPNRKLLIFNTYDRIIFSEDDNEFSPNFLDYINKGLDKFEADDSVFAICGYMYPVTLKCSKEYNYFFGKGFSAWGYGTWKNRKPKDIYTVLELKELSKNKKFIKKIKYYDERHYFNMLGYIKKEQDPTGDRAIVINLVEKDMFCVFPVKTKVRNWGHDGSGINCSAIKNNFFVKQKLDRKKQFSYSCKDPLFDSCLNNVIINYYKIPVFKKIMKMVIYKNKFLYINFYKFIKNIVKS